MFPAWKHVILIDEDCCIMCLINVNGLIRFLLIEFWEWSCLFFLKNGHICLFVLFCFVFALFFFVFYILFYFKFWCKYLIHFSEINTEYIWLPHTFWFCIIYADPTGLLVNWCVFYWSSNVKVFKYAASAKNDCTEFYLQKSPLVTWLLISSCIEHVETSSKL